MPVVAHRRQRPSGLEGKMKNEYRKIETTLDLLLMALPDSFSESESIEVQEFIDAGEYGIALETLCVVE